MRRSLGILLGTALAFLITLVAIRIDTLRRATALVDDIQNVDRAPDPSVLARALMQKYRKHLVTTNCEADSCQYVFLFSNHLISAFHLAPRSEIEVCFSIFKNSLDAIHVQYTSAVFKTNSPTVHVQEDFCGARTDMKCDHFDLNPHGRDVGPTWNGIVEFGQLATAEQKRAAWAFNLNCITTFNGCNDIAQLLPTIWKLTSPSTVSSRLRSSADSIAEASQPLPER